MVQKMDTVLSNGGLTSSHLADESSLLALDQYRGWCTLGFCRVALASNPQMCQLVAGSMAWVNLLFQVTEQGRSYNCIPHRRMDCSH